MKQNNTQPPSRFNTPGEIVDAHITSTMGNEPNNIAGASIKPQPPHAMLGELQQRLMNLANATQTLREDYIGCVPVSASEEGISKSPTVYESMSLSYTHSTALTEQILEDINEIAKHLI